MRSTNYVYVYYFIIVQNKAVIAFIIIIDLKYTMSSNRCLQISMSGKIGKKLKKSLAEHKNILATFE